MQAADSQSAAFSAGSVPAARRASDTGRVLQHARVLLKAWLLPLRGRLWLPDRSSSHHLIEGYLAVKHSKSEIQDKCVAVQVSDRVSGEGPIVYVRQSARIVESTLVAE